MSEEHIPFSTHGTGRKYQQRSRRSGRSRSKRSKTLIAVVACGSVQLISPRAFALDTQQDDFIPAPAGTPVVALYYNFANVNEFDPTNSPRITRDTKIQAQVGVIRLIDYRKLYGMPWLINVLQTFGGYSNFEVGGAQSPGHGFQFGQFTFGTFIWPIAHPEKDEYLAVGGYVHVGDGDYNPAISNNLSDNRVSWNPQVAYIHKVAPSLDFQIVGDINWYQANTHGSVNGESLRQRPTYEVQFWSSYQYSPLTSFAVGVAGTYGGYVSIDGVAAGTKTEYQQVRVSAAHFFAKPKFQIEVEADHYFHVVGGGKENVSILMRALKPF